MRSRWLAALVAGALLALAPAHAAAGSRIVGRLTLRERDRRLTPAEVERQLGRRLGLALRNGGAVVPMRLEGDGRFGAEVAPGDWRLEWLDVGDRQEVLATPLDPAVHPTPTIVMPVNFPKVSAAQAQRIRGLVAKSVAANLASLNFI